MESTSQPGCAQVSDTTLALLSEGDQARFSATGGIMVKVGGCGWWVAVVW